MLKRYDVLCIGSAVVDHFLTIQERMEDVRLGDKILVKHVEVHSGGGATNSAAALSKLGLKVKMLTKMGQDKEADFIVKEMKSYHVKNISLHHSKKATDFSTLINSSKEKDRIIYAYKGSSNDLTIRDFKKSQLKARWIYLASLMGKSLQTAKEIAKFAREKRINLLFNPSLYLAEKGKTFLREILKATTILVLNKEEAQALLKSKSSDYKVLLLKLQELGPEIVVITNGAKELYAYHQGEIYSALPPNVKVVHSAGSGDSFTSGLLAGMIKKYSFEDSLRLGLVNSISVIQHIGTKNKLLTEKEAKELMNKYKIKVKKIQVK